MALPPSPTWLVHLVHTRTPGPEGTTPPTTAAGVPGAVPGAPSTPPASAAAPAAAPAAPPTAPAAPETDAEIEALDLAEVAKTAACALKKKHPSVSFTSGRRSKEDQASAMAGNVVSNRKWIEETYSETTLSKACQKWVDDNPQKKTKAEIAAGLLTVLNPYSEEQIKVLTFHVCGKVFDVQPVEEGADEIKKTLKELTEGKGKFLEKEGGLVRWHAQFN